MKLRQVCNYQLYEARNALLTFYGVVFSIVLLTAFFLAPNADSIQLGGMEGSTIIFLFVAGLNSFKGPFRFMMANGVSRKSQFLGYLVSVPALAGVMTAIDTLFALAVSRLVRYESFFFQIYSERYPLPLTGGAWAMFQIEKLLWSLFFYSAVMMLGFVITLLYYRMNKLLKILVSVFVPVTVFVILPYIDYRFTNGKIFGFIGHCIAAAFGRAGGVNPYISMLSSSVSCVILAAISWLLMRRAVVKD